jgi:hypothetical protein
MNNHFLTSPHYLLGVGKPYPPQLVEASENCLTELREQPMPDLTDQFNAAMFSIYRRAKDEADYPANIFLELRQRS